MGRKILADAGYEVITVNNGSAALKKIGEQRPDLIVLDVYMPGYSGLEVCQRVKEVEDTIVPRNEPSKPGRFGRIAAAEDARFDKTMVVEEDSGWKNRIAFPSKKKEKEKEPEPEETMVPIASKNARTEFREMAVEAPAAQKSEGTVDLGALANAGLPKDVTPEEI